MPHEGGPKEFDRTTRDSVRRKINQYMTDHGIGVPKLALRIAEANPRKPDIPVKTLQRFLAGRHRTNDMYVRFFQHFAQALPDADPIGELGRAMAAFHDGDDNDRFVGHYTLIFNGRHSAGGTFDVASLTATADEKFCRATERFILPRSIISDGVLISRGNTAIIFLQDRLTGGATHYFLTDDGQSQSAFGAAALFWPDAFEVRTVSADVVRASSEDEMPSQASVVVARPMPAIPSAQRFLAGIVMRGISLLEGLMRRIRETSEKHQEISRDRSAAGTGNYAEISIPSAVRQAVPGQLESTGRLNARQLQHALLSAAEQADATRLRSIVEQGADINEPDAATGLTALHLAVGRDAVGAARFLIEHGAKPVPDKLGRMPSTIAGLCEASDEMLDLIADAEARAEDV
jgi:hypothetical protein